MTVRLLFACIGIPGHLATAQVIRDSAGVTILGYPPGSRPPATWTVDRSRRLEVGGADGHGPTEFAGVVGVVRLLNGTIVVANGASRELRYFDASGRFLHSAGGRGHGPGEFRELDGLGVLHDTVLAYDGTRDVRLYSSAGRFVRSVSLVPLQGHVLHRTPLGAFANGALLVRQYETPGQPRNGVSEDSLTVVHATADGGRPRAIMRVPAWRNFLPDGARYRRRLAFSPVVDGAVFAAEFCVGFGDVYEIRCADPVGRIRRIVRRDGVRGARVTAADRRAYANALQGIGPDGKSTLAPGLREHRARMANTMQYAREHPVFSQLLAARTGELWVRDAPPGEARPWDRRSPSESRWSVFAADGRWIAQVTLPAGFVAYDAGKDYVLGVSKDNDDVESVVQLPLLRRRAP